MSIEACEIYQAERENGVAVGYKLPERKDVGGARQLDKKGDAYFRLFKNKLDDCLDLWELERAYPKLCRR